MNCYDNYEQSCAINNCGCKHEDHNCGCERRECCEHREHNCGCNNNCNCNHNNNDCNKRHECCRINRGCGICDCLRNLFCGCRRR